MVPLRVGGQTYRVVTSASEEDLQRLAAVVDRKLATVVPAGRPITPQAMLLAAMALANDLEEEQNRNKALAEKAQTAFSRILQRVDTALDARPVVARHEATPSGGAAALGALQDLGPLGLPEAANVPPGEG
ncbi:MAG: cell division protein ZapA [Minicystis sp.]